MEKGFRADWIGELTEHPQVKSPGAGSHVYDLASLTKTIVTGSLVATHYLLAGETWNDFLATPLVGEIPELDSTPLEGITIGEVWEHRSGIAAHKYLFPNRPAPGKDREATWQKIIADILALPLGPKNSVYSDLGFLLLGLWLERIHQQNIEELWNDWKSEHGVEGLAFGIHPNAIPTETRHPAGEVNDDNAYALQGISSHAGIFGTAVEVWNWLERIYAWSNEEPELQTWLSPKGTNRFYGGWDRPSGDPNAKVPTSQAGLYFPQGVIGHLGFTGTAFWWHPASKLAGILLSNRVFPKDTPESKETIKRMRQEFFSRLWQDKLEAWGENQEIV